MYISVYLNIYIFGQYTGNGLVYVTQGGTMTVADLVVVSAFAVGFTRKLKKT
jgi:hypothetical protein